MTERPPQFIVVDPGLPVAREALVSYFAELNDRFGGFDPETGGSATDRAAMTSPNGAFLIITVDEQVIGCGGVQILDEDTAEVKRMWIHKSWRGRGLGHRLLKRLEKESLLLGRSRVVLDTNDTLKEAITMYERAGYTRIDRYNDNPYAQQFFEKHLFANPR